MNRLTSPLQTFDLNALKAVFGEQIAQYVSLARYTAARVGGPADVLITVDAVEQLVEGVTLLWEMNIPFVILGGGSNVLVSDAGVRGVVLHNRARSVHFDLGTLPPSVRVESGANFGVVARQAAARGLAGLEWAAGIPGSVGGAVVGNAGAHGGDVAGHLILAEILHRGGQSESKSTSDAYLVAPVLRERREVERLEYGYRTSALKRRSGFAGQNAGLPSQPQAVVLAASFVLERSTRSAVQAKMDEFVAYRRRTQPPGASMGSMFKNPPGDYAGRLIEAAGLKGTRVGKAEISRLHANFFVNLGGASAADIWKLIELARSTVLERSGVLLELEIELVGDWKAEGKA